MYAFELVGEDDAFAAHEARALGKDVERIAPGIAIATAVSEFVEQLAWTRTVCAVVGRTDPTVEAMLDALRGAELTRSGPVAVRARGLRGARIDTLRVEREMGGVLDERGFRIDLENPTNVLRVLISDDVAVFGWVVAHPGDDVGRRRPTDRPFFQPGSMAPRLARWLINVARIRPGGTVLDPMCGTGGIALEAARVDANAIALDFQERMVRGTRRNCLAARTGDHVSVLLGDATRLPFRPGAVDAVVFDAPYGRQSKVARSDPVRDAMEEAIRITRRGVFVADRPIADEATEVGWTVVRTFERQVHRSLTRHICHAEDDGPNI